MATALDQAIAAYDAHANPGGNGPGVKTPSGVTVYDVPPAQSIDLNPLHDAQTLANGLNKLVDPSAVMDTNAQFTKLEEGKKPTKAPAKKKAAASSTNNPTLSELEQQIAAGNIWNQLGQQLVGNQEALIKPVEESISGALTAPSEGTAAAQALASMGLSPDSKASAWLKDQISQANTADAPMQKAMNLETSEYEQGQKGISSALGAMGQANALDVATAPEADWLTSLVQHIMSNVNYYGQYGSAQQAESVIPAVQSALVQSGGGGQGVSGSIPITDTPQQIAAQIQAYYAQQQKGHLPSSGAAALKAAGGGTGGVIPPDVGTAPS